MRPPMRLATSSAAHESCQASSTSSTRQCASTLCAKPGESFSAGSCVITPSRTSGRLATASIMRDAFSDKIGATNTTIGIGLLVAKLFDEVRKHFPPPRPVVVHVVAPEIEPMWYSFPLQDLGEIPRRIRRFIGTLTRRNHDATVMLK